MEESQTWELEEIRKGDEENWGSGQAKGSVAKRLVQPKKKREKKDKLKKMQGQMHQGGPNINDRKKKEGPLVKVWTLIVEVKRRSTLKQP